MPEADAIRLAAVGDVTAFHREPESAWDHAGPVLAEDEWFAAYAMSPDQILSMIASASAP